MALDSDVAIVALIVSLVALFITFSQLSVDFFGTAPGYRCCSSSILGPWSRLRRRVFAWSDFRLEVHFATPFIAIIPEEGGHSEEIQRFVGEPVLLADAAGFNRRPKANLIMRLLREFWASVPWTFGTRFVAKRAEVREVLRETVVDTASEELEWKVGGVEWQIPPSREVLASWVRLLGALHSAYAEIEGSVERPTFLPYHTCPSDEAKTLNEDMVSKGSSSSTICSRPVVAIQYWRWDFMPPDLTKPMATSTLNNVLLIGLRLGMRWRVVDLQNSLFMADGNGYSLSSFEIRGLGLGFHFVKNGTPSLDRACDNTEAHDKMMFGIIPSADNPLVREDYDLVINGEVHWEQFYRTLGLSGQRLRNQMQDDHWEPPNEMITLLCPFLPRPNSQLRGNLSTLWVDWAALSCFHQYHGRRAFLVGLRHRCNFLQNVPKKGHLLKTVEAVRTSMDELHDQHSIIFRGGPWPNAKSLRHLRDIYDWTTDFFQNKSPIKWSEPAQQDQLRTRYVDLVTAHGAMSVVASREGNIEHDEWLKSDPSENTEQIRKVLENSGAQSTKEYNITQYFIAKTYIAYVADDTTEPGLHSQLLGMPGWDVDQLDDVEGAWWVLMLRGIVWDMACQADLRATQGALRWDGALVSSAFYRMKTPVWIA